MATDTLHEQLSLRLVAQEEVTLSKKSFTGSANDLLKRIRGDIICINKEIRRRHAAAGDQEHCPGELSLGELPPSTDVVTIHQ